MDSLVTTILPYLSSPTSVRKSFLSSIYCSCLFSSSNPEILKYKLNEYCSNLILRKIKDLEYERIEIINRYYRDYNINIICEINNKFKEIFVQTKYKKELVKSGEIIFNLKSNKEYYDFAKTAEKIPEVQIDLLTEFINIYEKPLIIYTLENFETNPKYFMSC